MVLEVKLTTNIRSAYSPSQDYNIVLVATIYYRYFHVVFNAPAIRRMVERAYSITPIKLKRKLLAPDGRTGVTLYALSTILRMAGYKNNMKITVSDRRH